MPAPLLAWPAQPVDAFSTTSTSASGFFSFAAVAAARPPMPPPITRMSADLDAAELLEGGHRLPPTLYGKPRSMTGG